MLIDSVSAHLNKGVRHDVRLRFRTLLGFLKSNGLSRAGYSPPKGEIPDDFELRSEQLTDEGMLLMRQAYDRWLRSIDRGKPETDLSVLERALTKLRASST